MLPLLLDKATLHVACGMHHVGQPLRREEGFDVDDYIAEGELGYRVGPSILLRITVDSSLEQFFSETRFSEDQVPEQKNDGKILLSATVQDTNELRAWPRSFGYLVCVLQPAGFLDDL